MKIYLEENVKEPTRAYPTDAGLDIYSRETKLIPAHGSVKFDTGVHIELPQGTCGLLKSKSGLNVKHGLIGEGVIDVNYSGSICVKLYNLSDEDYIVNEGDKIIQLLIVPIWTPLIEVVDELKSEGRGNRGFGSSGR